MNHTNDIHLILSIIILCIGITLLHVRGITADNKTAERHDNIHTGAIASLNAQDMLDYLMPLLISDNIEGAAALLPQGNPSIRPKLFDFMMEQKTSLSSFNKLLFLIAAAHTYAPDRVAQFSIFDTIEKYKTILPYSYTLLYAADDIYQDTLDALLAWMRAKGEHSFAAQLFNESIQIIIEKNNVHALETLLRNNVTFSQQQVDSFLERVIKEEKNALFITLLAQAHANLNKPDDAQHTPLVQAILLNNVALVKALLEAGADLNLIITPYIGSPLQIAIGNHRVQIELLLRNYGAKE